MQEYGRSSVSLDELAREFRMTEAKLKQKRNAKDNLGKMVPPPADSSSKVAAMEVEVDHVCHFSFLLSRSNAE